MDVVFKLFPRLQERRAQLAGTLSGGERQMLAVGRALMSQHLVAMINALERRELIVRKPHPSDRRAVGLHLTAAGQKLMHDAERTAQKLELDATAHLTATERKTLIRLLQKVYL